MKRVIPLLVVGLLVMAAGCKRGPGSVIKDTKTLDIAPGEVKLLYIPACKKVEITFKTEGGAFVNAYLLSKKDGEETENKGTVSGSKMGLQEQVTAGSLKYGPKEPPVELAAAFTASKRATVLVTITGE